MSKPRKSPYSFLTGVDVNTNDPAMTHENDFADELITDESQQEDPAPNKSANKDEWLNYRKEQGYTDEELDGLSKDQLQELADQSPDEDDNE